MVLSPLPPPHLLTHLCSSCHHLHLYNWGKWGSEIGIQLPKAKQLVMTELGDKSRSNSKARVLPHSPSCLPEQFLAAAVVKIHLLWNIHNVAGCEIKYCYKQWNNELQRAMIISSISSLPLPLPSAHRVHNKPAPCGRYKLLPSLDNPQPGATSVPVEEMR